MANEVYTEEFYNVSPAYLSVTREKFQDIKYGDPVLYKNACRYKNLRTITDDATKKVYHENWVQKFIDESEEDSIYIVNMPEENRLDMISNYFYNTPRFWWVIAQANYIIDPFNVPAGTKLRIPPVLSLYNRGGILSGN